MKSVQRISSLASSWLVIFLTISPALVGWNAETNLTVAKANFALGQHLVQLLETRDAKAFANRFTPTAAELESCAGAVGGEESLEVFKARRQKQALQIAAHLLATASRLGLSPDRVRFCVKGNTAERVHVSAGPPYLNSARPPATPLLSIILLGEPTLDSATDSKLRGEYELTAYQPRLFPGGWRVGGGIWWSRVPDGLADPPMRWELEFFSAQHYLSKPTLTVTNDPALTTLGNTLVRLLRERNQKVIVSEAMPSFDEIWNHLQEEVDPKKLPPRAELEKLWERQIEAVVLKPLRAFLNQMDTMGVDLSNAKITLTEAVAQNVMPGKALTLGSLDGISAHPVSFAFTVESKGTSKTGKSLAGEYSVVLARAERRAGRWFAFGAIAWDKLPEGLADAKAQSDVAFEKYVAEHGRLPPGTVAPDIRFTPLDNDPRKQLSDFRGKVVVLEFWATSCGPCQQPMSDLQTLLLRHPEWKERVAVVTVSLDENPDVLRAHLQKKGWNQTFNTWAGEGEFASPAAQAFRVDGIPCTYLIDASGTIVNPRRKSPQVIEDAKGNVVEARLRTVEELEEAITPLVAAGLR